MERLARGQESDNERLEAIGKSRIINKVLGIPIAPWELEQLDEIWLDTVMALVKDLPAKQRRIKAEQDRFRQFEKNHSTYGKDLRN